MHFFKIDCKGLMDQLLGGRNNFTKCVLLNHTRQLLDLTLVLLIVASLLVWLLYTEEEEEAKGKAL